ncbi:hypothetical protein [Pseudovibrio denitrificans]|uniref:hypothetical protein n=1 Tax=Pseudovibrio denitrificans TaxID=258256 RepID=UPI0006D0F039|nr:hypothetical protein [Pseudovibrio denitrificans]
MSILTRINIFGARLQEPIKSTDRRGLRRRTIGLALLVVTAAVVPVYDWIYANFDFPWDYWVVDSKAESLRNLTLVASAFLGLILLLWRSTSAHIQSSVSQKTLHADRFKNAASMISEEEIPARIGGIRTISELAEVDEEYYYLHCQKLLTTFIRERSRDYWLLQDGEKTPPVGEIHPEGKTSFKGTIKIGAYYGQEHLRF